AKLGPDHPDTLLTMANLAVNYRDTGRLAEAAAMMEEAWNRIIKLPASEQTELRWVSREVLQPFNQAGQFANAEPLYRALVFQTRKQFGKDHLETGKTLADLGRNLLQQKKHAEAEPLLREAVDIFKNKAPDDWSAFVVQARLGAALLGQKKYA